MSRRSRRARAHPSTNPTSKRSESAGPSALPFALLLLASGATALVFEALWVKQLGRVVGVELHAVSVALAGFFGGLALGSAFFGRWADRVARPLALYAWLEAGAAVLGVASTLVLANVPTLFATLREATGPLAWLLPLALVGVPAFLMGGTLPALLRALHPARDAVAPSTGRLYAANTAGAILGTLTTPFVLVPVLGIRLSAVAAGLVGLAVSAAALRLERARPAAGAVVAPSNASPASADARLALVLYAVAGGVALGYEVVWSELLVQFLSTRAHAFAVMLATYLAGLALGAFLFARWNRGTPAPWRTFGLLLGGAAASAVATVFVLGGVPEVQQLVARWALRLSDGQTVEMTARFAVAAGAVLLLPTLFLGAAFPAAARLVAGSAHVGRGVGAVAAVNTAGGVAGSLLTGFVLVPRLGLVGALAALAVTGAVLAGIAVVKGGGRLARTTAVALVLAVTGIAALTPRDRLATLLAESRGGGLLFYEESVGGTVAVLEQSSARTAPFRRLYIQGVSNSGDAPSSLRYMRLQALLPWLVHNGEPRSALVIGFGTGITAGALLTAPGLEERAVVELLPAVVRAGPLFAGNLKAASDERLHIRLGDGRQELLRRSDRYDLITLEPPPPSAAGVTNLYSRDFYALAASRLKPGGVLAQWWPLPTQNDEDSRSLVRSFLDVFPHASAWTTELHEVLLLGSMSPLELDGARVARRFEDAAVAGALAEVGVESAAALLATWLTGREGLEQYAGAAKAVTDDRPRIEHAAWVRRGEIQRVLPVLLGLQSDVPLPAADPLREAVQAERRELLGFYRFSLQIMAGERDAAGEALRDVMARDPRNPYYLWVAYGKR